MSKIVADLSAVTTVSIDLAKHVFQGSCGGGELQGGCPKALRRRDVLPFFASLPGCLVGMEACGSAHHRARELMARGMR